MGSESNYEYVSHDVDTTWHERRGGGTERLEQVERKGHCVALAGDHLFLQAGRRAAKDQAGTHQAGEEERPQARVPCHGASLVKEGRSRRKTPRSSYYLLRRTG